MPVGVGTEVRIAVGVGTGVGVAVGTCGGAPGVLVAAAVGDPAGEGLDSAVGVNAG